MFCFREKNIDLLLGKYGILVFNFLEIEFCYLLDGINVIFFYRGFSDIDDNVVYFLLYLKDLFNFFDYVSDSNDFERSIVVLIFIFLEIIIV